MKVRDIEKVVQLRQQIAEIGYFDWAIGNCTIEKSFFGGKRVLPCNYNDIKPFIKALREKYIAELKSYGVEIEEDEL
jgi:hypothetical protein